VKTHTHTREGIALHFDLTDDQRLLQKMIREFAEEEVTPGAEKRDREKKFPEHIFKQLADLGLLGLPFPEKYGGAGADTISFCIVVEELSKACGSTGITYAAHVSLGGTPIHMFGTEKQKETYLTPLCTGAYLGAFGLTEPSAGSDAGGTRTTARLENGEWVIDGSKCYITNASYARNLALTAVTGQKGEKKQISAFLVNCNTPGFQIIHNYEKLGLHASNTTELVLEGVRTPEDHLLGKQGEGFKQFLITLDGGRIGIGAIAIGIARAAYEQALTYAKLREQFGRRISILQAIQH
jgi:alkylation response protein AidB-like acyl-CoA dehydrogenase